MPRLWIMRSTHDIAFEFIAQDLSVASLCTSRHRLSDIRKRLVAIKPAQLDHFSVQRKSMIRKLRLAKTKPSRVFINNLRTSKQTDPHRIQVSVSKVP